MTREEFVAGYMERSGVTDWRIDGEVVTFAGRFKRLAIPCECGEDGCEGWAMVREGEREILTVPGS